MATMKVDKVVEDIRDMRIRGALDIALAAADAMESALKEPCGDTRELIRLLDNYGNRLKSSRPTAVSLPNAVDYILRHGEKNRDLGIDEFREVMTQETKKFIGEQKKALDKIAEIGSNLIEEGDVILIHCNSDTVIALLKQAWENKKKIEVICTETRPRYQGRISAEELSEHGIPVTLVVDSAANYVMKKLKVDKVIVGGDAVYANGDLVNKIGTSQIALCARELDVDFIAAVESIKFSSYSIMGALAEIEERDRQEIIAEGELPNVRVLNPAFDVTHAEFIDTIITEYGIIPPQGVYHILEERFSI